MAVAALLPVLPRVGALFPLAVAAVIAGSAASGLWSPTAAIVVDGAVPGPSGQAVAVVDHRPFGGTCALRGCDPKKMLISGAEAMDAAHRMQGRGVAGELRISWPELIAFKRTFTDPVPQKQESRYAAQFLGN